ncbi:MAG: DUF2914 domain-containing protein [Planctomycetota bacterium]|jgi:hypothetical protein
MAVELSMVSPEFPQNSRIFKHISEFRHLKKDLADVGKLLCYSKITGGGEGDSIKHRWYFGTRLIAGVSLDVSSEGWRTYSSKNILPLTLQWNKN